MNVFGAFTFGSLIKTFIPGLVWTFALARLLLDLHGWLPGIFPPLPAISGEEQNALVLAMPVAILLGLLSKHRGVHGRERRACGQPGAMRQSCAVRALGRALQAGARGALDDNAVRRSLPTGWRKRRARAFSDLVESAKQAGKCSSSLFLPAF